MTNYETLNSFEHLVIDCLYRTKTIQQQFLSWTGPWTEYHKPSSLHKHCRKQHHINKR